MKKRIFSNLLCVLLCAALLFSSVPFTAFAEAADTVVQMIEGEVSVGFAPAGVACTSSDPSVAWVDENGNLNAMKTGAATISDGRTEYTVTVGDYEDGSEVVGSLKLLTRYNDSMQFYDGHVYLLFTSYQDGVTLTVPDLYAAYEIDDRYYQDIREDISKGSNHTGSETYEYFSENRDIDSVTLDRGEIVTIGMYRGFDLSVPQAVLGSIRNSSLWKELTAAGKAAIVTAILDFLEKGTIDSDAALARIKAVVDREGLDYNMLLDGVVDGGVCFNRELYNQKLEWDQYENVTYKMDITRNQLDTMMLYLGGNNGNFSILKNSCATVALRAWNAAVGMRNGEQTSYYLTSAADGIFNYIDAPKGVRDNIVKRLPGYYLNNAQGVAEPDAGYQDDTGWVYVSAPEKVAPLTYIYDSEFVIDEDGTKPADLINAAKGDRSISYSKEAQEVGVSVRHETDGEWTTISGVDFTINDLKLSVDNDNLPEDGVNIMYPYAEPAENEYHRLLDRDGEDISGYYSEGFMYIHADSFPIIYRVTSASYEDESSGVSVFVHCPYDADVAADVYYMSGDEKIAVTDSAYLEPGTKVYIKPVLPEDDAAHILERIELDEKSVMDGDHYDAEENAYFVTVDDEFRYLNIYFEEAAIALKGEKVVQLKVGDVIDVSDYFKLTSEYGDLGSDHIVWEPLIAAEDGCVACDERTLTGVKPGKAAIVAYAAENPNICALLDVEVHDSFDDMCVITLSGDTNGYAVSYTLPEDEGHYFVPYSGYRIDKNAEVTVAPTQEDAKVLRSVRINGTAVKPGESYTVTGDTEIKAEFAGAEIKDLPKSVTLENADASCQLDAKVKYTGLLQFLPVYDSSVTYRSSDPLVAVDDNGLLTVAGDIPEGGCLAYVTAYAGSSNDKVSATCKVIVGDYQGERIVGKLTASARPINKAELVAHAMLTFNAYEDIDFDVSYYEYHKPNERFYELMQDYADNPDSYASDPVLYNENELGIEDRDSYFDTYTYGAYSETHPVQLKAGEGFTMSNYGYESTNLAYILKTLDNSTLASFSPQAQDLAEQIKRYLAGEEYDGAIAFDDLIATLVQMYGITSLTGYNPADGISDGGLMLNKEAYNQFRRNDSQLPNHYYSVEITADELAALKNYLSDPANNYYSLLNMSCSTSTVDIWNATLADRPELCIKGNYTGLAADPMSIYYELWLMKCRSGLDGEGGNDFYPHIVVPEPSQKPVDPDDPDDPDNPDESDEIYPVYLGAWYMLGDADGDREITIVDATVIQGYLASIIGEDYIDLSAASVDGDDVDITAATFIRRYLALMDIPYPVGDVFNRRTGDPMETIEETVIADSNGVKITANSFGRGAYAYLDLTIENSSDKDVALSMSPASVNGFQTPADFICVTEDGESSADVITVAAGSSEKQRLVFDGTTMDESFMEYVAQIRIAATLLDPRTYEIITTTDNTVINTSAFGSFDYSYDESGDVIYDDNDITIVFKGVDNNGPAMPMFYVNNKTDKIISLSIKESKVNGADIESYIGPDVFGGCRALCALSYMGEINNGDSAEVTFEICEATRSGSDKTLLYTADAFTFTL